MDDQRRRILLGYHLFINTYPSLKDFKLRLIE